MDLEDQGLKGVVVEDLEDQYSKGVVVEDQESSYFSVWRGGMTCKLD